MMKKSRQLKLIIAITFTILAMITFYKGASVTKQQMLYDKSNGEIVVVFHEELTDSSINSFMEKYKPYANIDKLIGDYALISVNEASNYETVLRSLKEDALVNTAQANSRVRIMSSTNDPYSDTQWYIDNSGQYITISKGLKRKVSSYEDVDMDVSEAWDYMAQTKAATKEVVIAVIDTGIDYKHPELADHMWINEGEIPGDNIDNDNNGYVDDIYGWDFYNNDATICHYNSNDKASDKDNDNHGTHVAGVIAALANNKLGIAGIASNVNVKIMSLKINGGSKGEGNLNSAIEAIKYATMMGADICNLSWGTDVYLEGLEEIMRESNMLFVTAAGNTGDDNDINPVYPASFTMDNLISVTFVDSNGMLTGLSNYGLDSVDLAAPGTDIYSTIVGGYGNMSGSSMAAPQVSAVAAMLYAQKDHLYAANVKDIITLNIKELEGLENYMIHGGIPSAYKAVVATDLLIQDKSAPVLTLSSSFDKAQMTVSVKVKDSGDSQVRVVKWIYGSKTIEDFKKGMNGTTVKNGKVNLSKAGKYTFYAVDYAGNETAKVYDVKEDKEAPKIVTTFTVSSNYKTRTVTVLASDKQSGVKRVKYMEGVKRAEDFLPAKAGITVTVKDGKGTFKVKKDGVYTIFAADNRGNITARPIIVKTVKITEFKFLSEDITIEVEGIFQLRSYVKPTAYTDKITYTSSNEKVAIVSSTGKITAISKGTVYITAKTASGLSSKCKVKVIPKKKE